MKKFKIFYFLLISLLPLSSCGPSQAEVSTQTSIAKTSIAASWTPTPTLTPTLTPTPTKTPLPTATFIGGGQGQIIFLDGDFNANKWEIYSITSKGTGRRQLTFLGGTIADPVWSPAGDKIAFSFKKEKEDFWQLYTMNTDGSGITKVSVNTNKNYSSPDWSPDGKKIAFVSESDEEEAKEEHPRRDVFIMNSDGTNEIRITNDPTTSSDDHISSYDPDWSADGNSFVFISYKGRLGGTDYPNIFIINLDGTERNQLTNFKSGTVHPKWSPDGKYIVFQSQKDGEKEWEIYIMNSDGTNVVQLTKNDTWDQRPRFTPDGTKISWDTCCFNLSIMNLDGSNVFKIYSEFGWNYDWKP